MVTAVVGANWGDEGKGKITDALADKSDIVVRFQGGANAGHTIINEYGRFALHILPSGIFHKNIVNIIGNGVALDINKFLKEIEEVTSQGVPKPMILISNRAEVLMPYHIMQDKMEEERLGSTSFGSTKSGIAPFYSDKYAKMGIQVCDLFFPNTLTERVNTVLSYKSKVFKGLYGNILNIGIYNFISELIELGEKIKPYVVDTVGYLNQAQRLNKNILLEGQLGSLKDPDFGIYPMTTSSHTLAGFGCVGAPVSPANINRVVCVTKAYSSCVGSPTEPFVSEITGKAGDELRRRGGDKGEFGATTGRPRRVGWFDAVATKYGCMVQGATEIAITCLDVLSYLDEIPICVEYSLDNDYTKDFPVTPLLKRARPVYKVFDGWKKDIRGIKTYNELPIEAKKYIDFIQEYIGIKITMISTGPSREDIIYIT